GEQPLLHLRQTTHAVARVLLLLRRRRRLLLLDALQQPAQHFLGIALDRQGDAAGQRRDDGRLHEGLPAPRPAQRHEQRGIARNRLARLQRQRVERKIRGVLEAELLLALEFGRERSRGRARDFHRRSLYRLPR